MTHREKVDRLLSDLAQRGVGRYTAAPPLYRLLWRLGIEVPPPFFASFRSLALLMGVLFGVAWGLFMWLLVWRPDHVPPALAAATALIAGTLFGVIMAAYYRWRASKLALPRWEDYPPQA